MKYNLKYFMDTWDLETNPPVRRDTKVLDYTNKIKVKLIFRKKRGGK